MRPRHRRRRRARVSLRCRLTNRRNVLQILHPWIILIALYRRWIGFPVRSLRFRRINRLLHRLADPAVARDRRRRRACSLVRAIDLQDQAILRIHVAEETMDLRGQGDQIHIVPCLLARDGQLTLIQAEEVRRTTTPVVDRTVVPRVQCSQVARAGRPGAVMFRTNPLCREIVDLVTVDREIEVQWYRCRCRCLVVMVVDQVAAADPPVMTVESEEANPYPARDRILSGAAEIVVSEAVADPTC